MTIDHEQFRPLFNQRPVVIRFQNFQDVIAVVWKPITDNAVDAVWLERPLRLERVPVSTTMTPDEPMDHVELSLWMPETYATYFPIRMAHILCMAPPLESLAAFYEKSVKECYGSSSETPNQLSEPTPSSEGHPSPTPKPKTRVLPDGSTAEEVIASYLDFFLHNFTPTGKPH